MVMEGDGMVDGGWWIVKRKQLLGSSGDAGWSVQQELRGKRVGKVTAAGHCLVLRTPFLRPVK